MPNYSNGEIPTAVIRDELQRVMQNNAAVFRTADDRIFALEDKCPHRNGPLSQGIVHDGCVTCPLHNWVISLETGAAQGADEGRTASFPIRLDGRDIYLNLTA